MSERSYTVEEIGRMRDVCCALRSWETGYSSPVDFAGAEDKLRTYILAGVDPDELCEMVKRPDGRMPVVTVCGMRAEVNYYLPENLP